MSMVNLDKPINSLTKEDCLSILKDHISAFGCTETEYYSCQDGDLLIDVLNRLDEIIVFNKLSKDNLREILDEIISGIEKRLVDINVKIKLTDQAKDYFIDNGYDEFYGARPLKRLVSNKLETLIAKKLINNEIKTNSVINIDYVNGKLEIN